MNETLHPNHRRQIDDGVRASLTRAGIGTDYHNRSLAEAPGGDDLVKWVTANGRTFFRTGGVAAFVGRSSRATNAMMLFARALHLSGVGVRVTNLPTLVRILDRDDTEALARLEEAPVLVVTRFYAPATRTDCPLTGWQSLMVEEFLTERKSNGNGLVSHVYEPFDRQTSPVWWRPDFLEAIGSNAKVVEIR